MRSSPAEARAEKPYLGFVLILLTYLFFSFVDASVKWLSVAGIPALQLAFVRYAGHVAVSTGIEVSGGVFGSSFQTHRLALVMLRGALLAAATVLNFISLKTLSLTLTSTIMFLSPVIVCALSGPFLGERVGAVRSFAVVLGFAGILVAIRPFSEDFQFAVVYSFSAAVIFAFYLILTRVLAGEASTGSMQFFAGLVGAVAFFPAALWVWQSPDNPVDWVVLIAIGPIAWLGHEFMTRAYRYTEVSNLVPFGYTFIIYLAIWSWLLFDHVPDIWNVWGALMVTAAGLIIWAREVRRTRTHLT